MSEDTVYVSSTRAALRRVLDHIPNAAQHSNALLTRIGMALLGRIKTAFVVKARGGTDETGLKWPPLAPSTVASRRGGRSRGEKKRPVRPSQALSAKQRERWWDLYRQGLAIYQGNKAAAAKRAWFLGKREGMTTLLQKYGSRQVEILRDTGLLLNSLSPGVASSERVFRVGHGEVIVGTNRKGAKAHHTGIPGRLPQRRLWPEPVRWTPNWWSDLIDQAKQGLAEIVVKLLRGA